MNEVSKYGFIYQFKKLKYGLYYMLFYQTRHRRWQIAVENKISHEVAPQIGVLYASLYFPTAISPLRGGFLATNSYLKWSLILKSWLFSRQNYNEKNNHISLLNIDLAKIPFLIF